MQRSGAQLRMPANLIRVPDGASLWTETFDVRFTDIFSVQDEVARQMALRLRPNLSAADQKQLAKQSTVNPAAYEYDLAGLRDFDQSSLTKMGPAIPMFQKAIELDSGYALAYAQTGLCPDLDGALHRARQTSMDIEGHADARAR
jgi:hypothetical protein